MKQIYFLLLVFCVSSLLAQELPEIEWSKTYGGWNYEFSYDIINSNDGKIIVVGMTESDDGDVSDNHGGEDFWVVKIDQSGNLIWDKSFGGEMSEYATKIIQAADGGYILIGSSSSINENDYYDFWILKIDESGILEWEKSFGGSNFDEPNKIVRTNDGGYLVVGTTDSNDGDITNFYGGKDVWVLKLDVNGNILWQNNYGGSQNDFGNSVVQLLDGSYVIGGSSYSSDGNVSNNLGSTDFWIFKLDIYGNLIWEKNFGGSELDELAEMQLVEGGILIFGRSMSSDGDVSTNYGDIDTWIVKIDVDGNLIWDTSIGGSGYDEVSNCYSSSNSTYFVGTTFSSDGFFDTSYGGYDAWLAKIDDLGSIEWVENYGGTGYDGFSAIVKTNDNNLVLFGDSTSSDFDVPENKGNHDFWIVKLSSEQMSTSESNSSQISMYPNPVKNILNFSEELNDIQIFNLAGQKVFESPDKNKVNVSHLNSGTFVLKAKNQKGESVQLKFVKN